MSLLVRTRADGTAEPPIAQPRSHNTFANAHWSKNALRLSPVSPGRPGGGVGRLGENGAILGRCKPSSCYVADA